jgi:hypothetical protein
MRNLAIIIFFLMASVAKGVQCTSQYVEFAEISFTQDSINPLKIHLVCKVKAKLLCPLDSDKAIIYFGDSHFAYAIPLIDTTYLPIGFDSQAPLKTYAFDYTYDSIYADSTVLVGLQLTGLYPYSTLNTNIDPRSVSLSPIAAINFAYLKNHRSISPPRFDTFTLPFDSIYHPLDFRPGISYDSTYRLKAEMIWPICYYPNVPGDVYAVGDYPPFPSNHVDFDSTNGHLLWNSPLGNGAFLICYRLSLYKQDTFVCNMTRDFMVNVLGSQRVGVDEIGVTQKSLRCYPSPTSGTFTVDMNGYDAGEKQVNVYDQLGQVIFREVTRERLLQINLELASGIYIVEVLQNSQREYTRIAKQ